MSPLGIGIDVAQTPAVIGGVKAGKFIAVKGTKGIDFNDAPNPEVVVGTLEDAVTVVKSFFGAPNFDGSIIVVPNAADDRHRNGIISFGRTAGFNITEVISENAAVAEAYAEKARPTKKTKLAVISVSGGILDVSVVSVVPINVETFEYDLLLHDHKAHPDPIDFEENEGGDQSGGEILGRGVYVLAVDPFEKALNILNGLLESIEIGSGGGVEKVVLVGKASWSEKFRHAAKNKFHNAAVWTEIVDADEVAVFGAAYASFRERTVTLRKITESESEEVSPGFSPASVSV